MIALHLCRGTSVSDIKSGTPGPAKIFGELPQYSPSTGSTLIAHCPHVNTWEPEMKKRYITPMQNTACCTSAYSVESSMLHHVCGFPKCAPPSDDSSPAREKTCILTVYLIKLAIVTHAYATLMDWISACMSHGYVTHNTHLFMVTRVTKKNALSHIIRGSFMLACFHRPRHSIRSSEDIIHVNTISALMLHHHLSQDQGCTYSGN